MASPFERAFALHPSPEEFRNVLEAHLLHGRIISTDRVFLMVRPVWRDWDDERMLDPWQADEDGDCFYAWDVGGDLSALREIPSRWIQGKQWVAFHCQGRRRVSRASRVLNMS